MNVLRKILKWGGILLVVAVVGLLVAAFFWGRPKDGLRPDLVTALPAGVPPAPHGYPSEALSYIAAFTLHSLIPFEDGPAAPGVEMKENIEYGKGDGTSLVLDLYSPKGNTETLPGVVLFYGGGWRDGRKDQLRVYAQYFAQHGYVVATPQYRLRDAGLWPKSVHDAKCAMRWMRAHAAENHVDPKRIGVMGNSAGGYLALMVGYTPGDPFFEGEGGYAEQSSAAQAVVDIYGPTDFTEPERRDHPLLTKYMNGKYDEDPSRFEKASPIRYVTAQTPPTCVIHGTVDMLVPVHQSDWLVEKLKETGVPYVYDRMDGWPHAMDIVEDVNDHTKALILVFLDEHLKGKKN